MAMRRDNRRSVRLDVRIPAGLREMGTTTRFEIDIIDLSISGFRCESAFTLRLGQQVFVTFPTFAALEATVTRRQDFSYGCAFEQPLHRAVFEHIVARHARVED